MKKNNLPYIPLDEEYGLNIAMLAIAISVLSHNKKGSLSLDINKLQIFIYLIRNPSRIDAALIFSDKKPANLENQLTYTIKSFSSNVDILFDNKKIKFLLKKMVIYGILYAVKESEDTAKLLLSDKGIMFVNSLVSGYFLEVKSLAETLLPLQSMQVSRLNSVINKVFKGQ